MREKLAVNNFHNGYNCCQAVLKAFEDVINVDTDTLLKMGSAFGGGISRIRETCGAISAIAIVIGYFKGYSDPNDYEVKKEVYEITQSLIKEFISKHKYMTCKELLNLNHNFDSPTPSIRTKEFYENRPCSKFISDAALILENYLAKENLI